jgi:protein SCO1
MKHYKLITILCTIFALIFIPVLANAKTIELSCGTLLPQPRTLNAFQLTGTDGKPFTNQNLKGHWSLLFFGFTNCGYVCPTTMMAVKKIYINLKNDNQTLPQVYLISIDPVRDTPERIRTYVTRFNPHFQGATGDQKQLDDMTRDLGVLYMKVKPSNANLQQADYDIDHSGTLLLINPEGKLAAIFSMPHDPELITKDYQNIISR